jgi:hypothetical protein
MIQIICIFLMLHNNQLRIYNNNLLSINNHQFKTLVLNMVFLKVIKFHNRDHNHPYIRDKECLTLVHIDKIKSILWQLYQDNLDNENHYKK